MTRTDAKRDPGRGVYGISVAAELVGMAPQSLRLYEQRGLLEPARSIGGTRRYTEVTCRVTRETPAEQGFHGFRGWVFWLLQGQWDRCVQEFEGSALG